MIKLVSAKCPNCGANLKLSKQEETAECEYCHKSIIVDDAIACYKLKVTGTVSVDGIQSNSELISAANELLNMGEYLKAKRKFLEFTEKNPNDYQGWIGLLICRTRNFKIRDNNNLFENDVNTYYQHFMETAPSDIREKYKRQLENYFQIEQEEPSVQVSKSVNIQIDPNLKNFAFPLMLILFGIILLASSIKMSGFLWVSVGIIQIMRKKIKNKSFNELSKLLLIAFIIAGFVFLFTGI